MSYGNAPLFSANSLATLTDTFATNAATIGEVLTYKGAGVWGPGSGSGGGVGVDELSELIDVDITTDPPVEGQVLTYDGINWINETVALKTLADVKLTVDTPPNGAVLTYVTTLEGGKWTNALPGTQVNVALDGLSDVRIENVANGNGIYYENGEWVNNGLTLSNDGVVGWDATNIPPVGESRNLVYTAVANAPGYTVGPAAAAAIEKFVELSDVSVAPTPIAGAVTLYDAVQAKWVQTSAITHNAAADDKIALTTAGAVAILSTGDSIGIQATNGEIAIASAGDASLLSSLGNTAVTSLANSVQITSALATTVSAGSAINIESTGSTVDVNAVGQIDIVSNGGGVTIGAPVTGQTVALSAPTGVVLFDGQTITNSNEATTISLFSAGVSTLQGATTTEIGESNPSSSSITNIRAGGAGELNIIGPQSGIAFIPAANTQSILTIEEDFKSAAQYASDIAADPTAIPNVAYVSSAITSAVSGNDATDIKVGGNAPATTLVFGTTNAQDISITKNSNAVFGTSTTPDELTYVRNQTVGGDVEISADTQVTVQAQTTVINDSTGTQRFAFLNTGEFKSLTATYTSLVTTDNSMANKKYVDDALAAKAISTLSDVTLTAADPNADHKFLRWDDTANKWTDSRVRYQVANTTVGETMVVGETIVDTTTFIPIHKGSGATDFYYSLTTKAEPSAIPLYPTDIIATTPNTWYQRSNLNTTSFSPVVWTETQSAVNKILGQSATPPVLNTTTATYFPFPSTGPPYIGTLNISNLTQFCFVDFGLNMTNFSTGFTMFIAGHVISNRAPADPEDIFSINNGATQVLSLRTSLSSGDANIFALFDGATETNFTVAFPFNGSVGTQWVLEVSNTGTVNVYALPNNLANSPILVCTASYPSLVGATFDRIRLGDNDKLSQSAVAEMVVYDSVVTPASYEPILLSLREGLQIDPSPTGGYILRQMEISAPVTNDVVEWDGTKFANAQMTLSKLADAEITAPTPMQGLYYDPTTSNFVNRTRSHPIGELTYGGTDPLPEPAYGVSYTLADTWYEIEAPAALVSNNTAFTGFAGAQWNTNGLGRIQWLGMGGFTFHLTFSICMSISGSNGDDYDFAICQNGTASPFTPLAGSVVRERLIVNGKYQVLTFHKVVTLATNDTISLITRSSGTTRILSIANLNIILMPDKMY